MLLDLRDLLKLGYFCSILLIEFCSVVRNGEQICACVTPFGSVIDRDVDRRDEVFECFGVA